MAEPRRKTEEIPAWLASLGRIMLAVLPFVVGGAIALITVQSDVRHLEQRMTEKSDRVETNAQYSAILRELTALREEVLADHSRLRNAAAAVRPAAADHTLAVGAGGSQ